MGTIFSDPGPCPVDDSPHTTCTSHDSTTRALGIVIQQLPMRDAMSALETLAHKQNSGEGLAPTEVTTATYRRKR